jgi:hypothetical protein
MTALALTLSTLVVAQMGAAPAEDVAAYTGEVYCDQGVLAFDPSTVHVSQNAPPGGVFWLPLLPSDGTAARILFSAAGPSLRTGGGDELTPEIVRETLAAVAIAVPDGAEVGATFLLHPANSSAPSDTLLLRVVEPTDTAPTASVVVGTPVANPFCYADCYSGEQPVPRAPSVDITVEGGPVVVDAWQTFVGGIQSALEPRLVDTRLVTPTSSIDGPVPTTLQVGFDYLSGEASMTLVVEVRSAIDGTLLSSSSLVVESLEEVFYAPPEEERWECGDVYYDDYYDGYGSCLCAGGGDPSSVVGLALFMTLLRRRRRSDR